MDQSLLDSALAFQRLLILLGDAGAAEAAALLELTTDPEVLAELYAALVDRYCAASGQLTAQWYQDLSPDGLFDVRSPLPLLDKVKADVVWALKQPDPPSRLAAAVQRRTFNASRETVIVNADREGVRFARLARATACPWCRVIATNEAHYRSADTATKGHNHCYCVAVPIRAGQQWTPPGYVKDWEAQYQAAARKLGTTDIDALAKEMRPAQYAMVKDDVNARRRELYAQKKQNRPDEVKQLDDPLVADIVKAIPGAAKLFA